jgi:hypothetical protein
MKTIPTRLEPGAIDILKQHADNPSEAIRVMQRKLTVPAMQKQDWVQKSASALSNTGGLSIGAVDEKEYWKKMRAEMDALIVSHAGR